MDLGISVWDILWGIIKAFFMTVKMFWQAFAILGLILTCRIVYNLIDKSRLSKSGIAEIDNMSGKTFEKYLEVLFSKLDYQVHRTQYIGDYGADLITTKNGVRTVIQAKRHKNKVGIKAVQEAVAAKGKYDCQTAMVVTNSFYTKQAIELAKANKVELWDRGDLVKALLSVKDDKNVSKNDSSSLEVAVTGEKQNTSVCSFCGCQVSEKVKQFCLSNPQRFGGKIFCYDHQRKR